MFLSGPKHTKPVDKTNRIALGTTAGAGHRSGADGGVVFDVGGFEDVAAVGTTEFGDTT